MVALLDPTSGLKGRKGWDNGKWSKLPMLSSWESAATLFARSRLLKPIGNLKDWRGAGDTTDWVITWFGSAGLLLPFEDKKAFSNGELMSFKTGAIKPWSSGRSWICYLRLWKLGKIGVRYLSRTVCLSRTLTAKILWPRWGWIESTYRGNQYFVRYLPLILNSCCMS